MMASRSSLLLLVSVLAGLAQTTTQIYDGYIDKAYVKCDVSPTDGALSCPELADFFAKLNMTVDYTQKGGVSLCNTIDADSSGGIVKQELIDWMKTLTDDPTWRDFFNKIMQGMTGMSDATTEGIGETNDLVVKAYGYIEVDFTIAEDPADLFLGERIAIKDKVALALGLSAQAVTTTITKSGSARRRLAASGGEVDSKGFCKDEAEQDSAKANAQQNLGSKSAASSFLGVTVTSEVTISTGTVGQTFEISYTAPIAVLVTAVVLCILTCVANKKFSKKARDKKDAEYKGCCSTGCCSAYALKGWSTGVFLAVLFNLTAGLILFVAMGPVKTAVLTIIDELQKTRTLTGDIKKSTESLEGVLTILDQIEPYVQLLDIVVIVPVLLASATLMVAAACGTRDQQTMKWMKLFGCLSMILLAACVVFYIIFVVLAYAITLDAVQDQLKSILAICSSTHPVLKQSLNDAKAMVATAEGTVGVSATDLAKTKADLVNAQKATTIFGNLCDTIQDLFNAIANLFIPAACCVVAAGYSFYMIFGMCCAAKCCCSPKTKPKSAGMTPIGVVKNDDTVSV